MSVGTLRPDLVAACSPYVFDVVVAGQDKPFAGALMISRFAFNSFKYVNPSGRVRFTYIVFVPLAFILIFLHPAITLLVIFGLYAASAPSIWLYRKLRRRNRPSPSATHE